MISFETVDHAFKKITGERKPDYSLKPIELRGLWATGPMVHLALAVNVNYCACQLESPTLEVPTSQNDSSTRTNQEILRWLFGTSLWWYWDLSGSVLYKSADGGLYRGKKQTKNRCLIMQRSLAKALQGVFVFASLRTAHSICIQIGLVFPIC